MNETDNPEILLIGISFVLFAFALALTLVQSLLNGKSPIENLIDNLT